MKTENINAYILAGGRSQRIGRNKLYLDFGGVTLIQIMINKIRDIFQNATLISNSEELNDKFSIKAIKDIHPDAGPLGGIYTGLSESDSLYNFFIPCDMPFLTLEIINTIVEKTSEKDIVIPSFLGEIQPLCGVYSKRLLTDIEKIIKGIPAEQSPGKKSKSVKMFTFINSYNIEIIDFSESQGKSDFSPFFNINTEEDYQSALRIFRPNSL